MRVTRIVVCLVLATGCAEESSDYPDVRAELSRTHEQLGGGMALFAATVVEGGGVKGSGARPQQVVLDVSREFPGQWVAPGRVKLGTADRDIPHYRGFAKRREPRVQGSGERHAHHRVWRRDRQRAGRLRQSRVRRHGNKPGGCDGRPCAGPGVAYQFPLFLGALGFAFAAVFLAWSRVKFGLIALAVSIALWLGV